MTTPEAAARQSIDAALEEAGWIIQDARAANLQAGRGVAIREVPLRGGHGTADYLLFADGRAVGAVEAKAVGSTLTGVELQTGKYSQGLPPHVPAPVRPLPFLYESTGVETRFTNRLDPEPRSRRVFQFHRPVTLTDWLDRELRVWPILLQDAAEQKVRYGFTSTELRAPQSLHFSRGGSVTASFGSMKTVPPDPLTAVRRQPCSTGEPRNQSRFTT